MNLEYVYGGLTVVITLAGIISTWLRHLQNRITGLQTEISDHKLETARNFVTARMLEQAEARITSAIDKLGDRLEMSRNDQADRVAERLVVRAERLEIARAKRDD